MKQFQLLIAVLAFVLSSVVGLYGQASGQEAPLQKGPEQPLSKEKRFVATIGSDGIQHVTITGGEYYFEPNYIVVKANVPVQLLVKKAAGYVPHDIRVKAPEAGIAFEVDLKDKPQVVMFTPTTAGKYEMYCTKKLLFFKSHKNRGMDGVIEVVP